MYSWYKYLFEGPAPVTNPYRYNFCPFFFLKVYYSSVSFGSLYRVSMHVDRQVNTIPRRLSLVERRLHLRFCCLWRLFIWTRRMRYRRFLSSLHTMTWHSLSPPRSPISRWVALLNSLLFVHSLALVVSLKTGVWDRSVREHIFLCMLYKMICLQKDV